MAGSPLPRPAAEVLERLSTLSLRELSMEGLLHTLADLATSALPGDTEASVTLIVKDRPATVASTGQFAVDLDERQYEAGQGPCLHAARSAELTEIADTRTDPRWPRYAPRAAEHGNLSSLSIPLLIDAEEPVLGALTVYAREPAAFDEGSRSAARAFGPYAAVAAGNMYAYQNACALANNLRVALKSRAVIDQAKGILMERYKVSPEQAFQLLARSSMHANRKVREIAEELVSTGGLAMAVQGRGGPSRTPSRRAPGAPRAS